MGIQPTTTDALAVIGATKKGNGTDYSGQIAALQAVDAGLHNQVDAGIRTGLITYCGTSIPAGALDSVTGLYYGYPNIAAARLGANINNQARPSSNVRISHKDGSYTGAAWQSVLLALADTVAEKNTKISNWATIYPTLSGSPPTDLNAQIYAGGPTYAAYAISCSYENLLSPAIVAATNLFVFDHLYNDYQFGQLGTPADTMTDFTTVPSTRNDRRYALGAMNYILDYIFALKPKARICMFGHYENQQYPWVSTAQQTLATYWELPLNKTWEQTGWSQQVNTATGLTIKHTWLADDIHPYDAESRALLANKLYYFLNTVL